MDSGRLLFTLVPAKHSKPFSLVGAISVGVDRMQWNFQPMRKLVEPWQGGELRGVTTKVVIYEAFTEGRLETPKHLARQRAGPLFRAEARGIPPRTIWSLHCLVIASSGDSSGTDFNRLRAATGRANGMGLSLL